MANMKNGKLRALCAAALAAGGAAAVQRLLDRRPPAGSWTRTSYSGADVSLTEGAAAAGGVALGLCALPGKARLGALAAVAAAGAAGAVDDHFEDRFPARGKGFAGHLGALREGRMTSGVLKIGLISAGAGVGALGLPRRGGFFRRGVAWAGQTALVAGAANFVNLLDLRPGRALKANGLAAAGLIGAGGAPSILAAGVLGASAPCLPGDLSGATMLGDLGANALGAATGLAVASVRCESARWAALAGIVALTLASERVSFSKVIEGNPVLARIDRLGRA